MQRTLVSRLNPECRYYTHLFPSGTMLSCDLHPCPQRCHQLSDHSNIKCRHMLQDKCLKGHKRSRECHERPRECIICEGETRRKQEESQRAMREQERRAREEHEHFEHMARLEALLSEERQRSTQAQLSRERALVIRQKERDLADARAMNALPLDPLFNAPNRHPSQSGSVTSPDSAKVQSTLRQGSSKQPTTAANLAVPAQPTLRKDSGKRPLNSGNSPAPDWTIRRTSGAKKDWEHQKAMGSLPNSSIESLMDMIGLEEVKLQILQIKAKIEVSKRQNADIRKDRLNVSFLGNPGTGECSQSTVLILLIVTWLIPVSVRQNNGRSFIREDSSVS